MRDLAQNQPPPAQQRTPPTGPPPGRRSGGGGLAGLANARWLRDGRSVVQQTVVDGHAVLAAYQVITGEQRVLVRADELKRPDGKLVSFAGHEWSDDETALLLSDTPNGRGRSQGNLYHFSLIDRCFRQFTHTEAPQRNAKLSPDGRCVGLVRADDLWVIDVASGAERRLTRSAGPARYNGRFGWVYEEELDLVDGWLWSPDGRTIAYCQVDESQVPVASLPNFDDLHLTPTLQRYPKPGDPNPRVRVGFVCEAGGRTVWADLGKDPDVYVARIQWAARGEGLLIQRMNRAQNRIDLLLADPHTGRTRVLLTESDSAWVDVAGDVYLIPSRDEFLWLSERDGYNHLYLYRMDGTLIRQVTRGRWDVTSSFTLRPALGWPIRVDEEHRLVYFTAAMPNPTERQVCYAPLDGGDVVRLSAGHGTHTPNFSPTSNLYLCTHSSLAEMPELALFEQSGRRVRTLVERPQADSSRPRWELLKIPLSDGTVLYGRLLKPPGFDPAKKHPVMVSVYGGPGSQTVTDSYQFGAGAPLAPLQARGYLLFAVDGRGTAARGRDWKKITHRSLGDWETRDQVAAAKYLARLPYVDGSRIGIWGASYGGYMALLCLLKGGGAFKAAVAWAPVTHCIYTERYMSQPAHNPTGYRESAPLTHAPDLRGKLLLLQGTADDNVHFQNSARLAQELQRRGISFETMFYPGKRHGMGDSMAHATALIVDFVTRNL
jgi:dipeptidyl-peptidase-4